MAHKVMVGGTIYEVSGGTTLINGTAYSIKNGKTMNDGTVYEIGFGVTIPLKIKSARGAAYGLCFVNDVNVNLEYNPSTSYYEYLGEIPADSVVKVVSTSDNYSEATPKMTLNGVRVGTRNGNRLEYILSLDNVKTIDIIYGFFYEKDDKEGTKYYAGDVSITTT